MPHALSSSPPILPIPRQPSPLSFSSVSANELPSPGSTSSQLLSPTTQDSSPSSSRLHSNPDTATAAAPPSRNLAPLISPPHTTTPNARHAPRTEMLPVDPLPDSLLLRSTFNALEHSATTLKRLSKSVLAATATYLALLEQIERAEDDVFASLGDLGRWLEGGYGVQGSTVWDHDGGVRKIRKDARRREREEMEVMVDHGLRALKADLKRNGLAGGGAHTRFDNTAKQFYQQTSAYLSPNPSSTSVAGPSNLAASSSSTSSYPTSQQSQHPSYTSDLAQASRSAQFDLVRYSHHSTLLYTVPPSSIACLDLLVGLYSWAGGLLGESPEKRKDSFTLANLDEGNGASTPRNDKGNNAFDISQQHPSHHELQATSAVRSLKDSLSISLASLANIRGDLLQAWARRSQQTLMLEESVLNRQREPGATSPVLTEASGVVNMTSTPISSAGIEHKKPRKMHKLHRSVGGKLRELLSSSGSTTSLSHLSQVIEKPAERATRASFDSGLLRNDLTRTAPLHTNLDNRSNGSPLTTPTTEMPPQLLGPVRRPSLGSPRPRILSRHSMHATRPEYVSPFIASQALTSPLPSGSSPDLRLQQYPKALDSVRVGGVGGLGAGGDEDEMREEAGRKKEGVLWGAGTWESLSKGSAKGKWEILDRSRIYEYRDNGWGKPDSAYEVIDLKFASVREGRGTDRRFVFEIVTPTQGRRQYQATSEYEMKRWLYAICNAIESCINGTSSVRTFDTSKHRTVSGSLDDHALPTRQLLDRQAPRVIGLGLPMPSLPADRQSMPPLPRSTSSLGSDGPGALSLADGKRGRKPSLKKVLRQSAEIANEKWNNVVNNRNSTGGLDLLRPGYLAQTGRTGSNKSSTSAEEIVRTIDASSTPNSTPMGKGDQSTPTIHRESPWVEDGLDDIEKRVLEMAGLGLGLSPGSNGSPAGRRVRSDGTNQTIAKSGSPKSNNISRTKSADAPAPEFHVLPDQEQVDMRMLRAIADLPENRCCADCGKGMKSSRWATLSLREMPMVLFLCIRCVGIHRSLGTHISKPRSVDLDIWNAESIISARQWGNAKGNSVWERAKPDGLIPSDENIDAYIRAKYVEGRWLDDAHIAALGLHPPTG